MSLFLTGMGQHHRALSEPFPPKSSGAQGVFDGGVAAKIPVTCSIEEPPIHNSEGSQRYQLPQHIALANQLTASPQATPFVLGQINPFLRYLRITSVQTTCAFSAVNTREIPVLAPLLRRCKPSFVVLCSS